MRELSIIQSKRKKTERNNCAKLAYPTADIQTFKVHRRYSNNAQQEWIGKNIKEKEQNSVPITKFKEGKLNCISRLGTTYIQTDIVVNKNNSMLNERANLWEIISLTDCDLPWYGFRSGPGARLQPRQHPPHRVRQALPSTSAKAFSYWTVHFA